MVKRFFLISQVFYPDEVSTAGLFTDLCVELARRGVDVEVWCAHPSYNTRKRQKRKSIEYKGVTIKYLASTNFRKDSISTIFYLIFIRKVFYGLGKFQGRICL